MLQYHMNFTGHFIIQCQRLKDNIGLYIASQMCSFTLYTGLIAILSKATVILLEVF